MRASWQDQPALEAIGGAVTVAKVTDPPADGALNGSPQREVPMNDLEIIREKLERLLLAAGELRLFTAADFDRGFAFQRQITPASHDHAFIEGISVLEEAALGVSPERARTLFEQEIAKARARAQANGGQGLSA
jgi:hypothetical protein